MYCNKCGRSNREEFEFCCGCGTLLKAASGTVPVLDEDHVVNSKDKSLFLDNMPQLKPKAKKKMSKLPAIIVVVLMLFFGVSAGAVFGVNALNTKKYDELIDTGNKYLQDLAYEEAIETFLEAIDVNPKREDGYVGAATGYIGLDEPDSAKDILDKGLKNVKEPGMNFITLCDELGVWYEGSQTEPEPTSKDVQKQYTAENLEEISRYVHCKVGYDDIDWGNITPAVAGEMVIGALKFKQITYNISSSDIEKLTGLMERADQGVSIEGIYRLADINENIRALFGEKSRPLTGTDFAVFDGSKAFLNGLAGDYAFYVAYYPDSDYVLLLIGIFGILEMNADFIAEATQQGDEIKFQRQFYGVSSDLTGMISAEVPEGIEYDNKNFGERQQIAKEYYQSAKASGNIVFEKTVTYTLAYNADGTIYLKSVGEQALPSYTNSDVQVTESFFGRVISEAYMVKTTAGGPLNIRSGPGLTYTPVTTIPNGTAVNGLNLSKDEQWVFVMVNGVSGWAAMEFLILV